jgi:hypothetical protein
MVTKVQSLQQYMWLNARETMQRFVGSLGGKSGLPVATNDLRRVAFMLQGEIRSVGPYSIRDAAVIMPARGLPKLFVATTCGNYRDIFAIAYENLGIPIGSGPAFDVDHGLAKTLALGNFEHVLMNPVSPLVNRTFGATIEIQGRSHFPQ